MQLHPMQIKYVAVRELVIRTFTPPDPSFQVKLTGKCEPFFKTSHNEYDNDEKNILVIEECEIGKDNPKEDTPIFLRVELGVIFKNIGDFSKETVVEFAERYSHFMIYPFLREHVFALSARSGLQPILLPSIQIPIFSKSNMLKTKK